MERGQDTAEELRRLLSLAEQIQDEREMASRRRGLLFVQEVSIAAAGVIVASVVAVSSLKLGIVIAVTILVGAVLAILVAENLRSRIARRAAEEQRALGEVVAIVREVESAASHDQDWSPLEKAEFRIRLSRFEA